MDTDALVSGLNPAQLDAVTTTAGPVVVLAGAGSGKTRVLTRRIAWRVADGQTDPTKVMALTFTRKAAAELRSRLRSVGVRDDVAAGTFHAMALLQLRQRWAERGVAPPALVGRKLRLLAQLLPSRRGRGDVLEVASEIDWARARLVGPDDYPAAAAEAGRVPPIPAEQIGELLDRYQKEKRRRRVVDFDDLLTLAIRDMQDNPRYADAIRWRFRHLYVDEFQDVNPLQYELLSLWRGDRPDLFIVGDPNQAIYGWNGADPSLLQRFVKREPEAKVIELLDNYRSSPQILALAAELAASGLAADRSDGPVPTITPYPDDRAEAAGVAERAREARSIAGDWSDQAVLVRTNAQLAIIEQAMADAGVPTRIRGGQGPLGTPEVRTELKLLTSPGVDLVAAITDLEARLSEPLPVESLHAIERRANLSALVRLVTDYVRTDIVPTGPGLEAWIGTLQAGDVDVQDEAVELATFHSAKGLEWNVVHIAGLEDGFVPIAYAETGAQRAEEKRLLYVAVTRAMEELHLSWAAERTFTSKPVTRAPSPLLAPLADAVNRLGVGPAHRVDWRAQIARSRESLTVGSGTRPRGESFKQPNGFAVVGGQTEQVVLYQALSRWRQHRARAADVPPHAVFTDQTLRAIALARPSTTAQLASVPGVRPAKLQRYGDDLLEVVHESQPQVGR